MPITDRIAFNATPDAVANARQRAIAFAAAAGVPAETGERVALAVSEAVTNAVVHAYVDADERGPIELEGRVEDLELVICVRDSGRGMGPRTDSPGLGLGLPLIGRVADRFELASLDGRGTEVCMRFALGVR